MSAEALVRLPYAYEVGFVPKGGRKRRDATVKGHADFAVPSVTSAEAPVAARYVVPPGGDMFPSDRKEVVTRAHDGRAFVSLGTDVPVTVADLEAALVGEGVGPRRFGQDANDVTTSSLARAAAPRWLRDLPGAEDDRDVRFRQTEAQACGEGATILASDASQRLSDATVAHARDYLLVDGEVWVDASSLEPFYLVEVFARMEVRLVAASEDPGSTYTVPFPADRREDAVAFARKVAEGWRLPFVDAGHVIEVPGPSGLVRDLGAAMARRLAFCRRYLTMFPETGGSPAGRRLLVAARHPEDGDALFEAAFAYVDSLEGDARRSCGFLREAGPVLLRLRDLRRERTLADEEAEEAIAALAP